MISNSLPSSIVKTLSTLEGRRELKGVLICVLAFGLLMVIFALLIGTVVMSLTESFSKKEKSQKGNLTESNTDYLDELLPSPDPVTNPVHDDWPGNIYYIHRDDES